MKATKINVILADDHPIVKSGISNLLKKFDDINLIATASNGKEALELVKELQPDLLLTDISMPELNGLELSKTIANSPLIKTKVVILSMHENKKFVNESFEAGAKGYLLKDAESDEIIEAIRQVYNGKNYCSKSISQVLINDILNNTDKSIDKSLEALISKREKEVLKLIYEGLSNKQIATELFLSTRTIDAHRYNIMQKLSVKNTAELIKKAISLKLIDI